MVGSKRRRETVAQVPAGLEANTLNESVPIFYLHLLMTV